MAQAENNGDASLAGRIARALSERIVAGVLAPGAPLRQDHVAAEFHASHVPVREAFRKLEARGLLVGEPRRGVRVAPLEPSAVVEVTEMRAALEVLALGHAIDKIGAADLDTAARALAEGEASRDIAVWEAANRRFHRAITAPCAMPRLIAAIDELHQASARFLFATWQDLAWRPRSDDEHREILKRLEAGDAAAAAEALRGHIIDAGKALRSKLADGSD